MWHEVRLSNFFPCNFLGLIRRVDGRMDSEVCAITDVSLKWGGIVEWYLSLEFHFSLTLRGNFTLSSVNDT